MNVLHPTYVIFDGDNDRWAYTSMLDWKQSPHVGFDFRDADHLHAIASDAQSEAYVKRRLREHMGQASVCIVLVGEHTRHVEPFIRWQLELALELDLPLVVANLNGMQTVDQERCPPIIRNACSMHVPFRMTAIRYAMNRFPPAYRGMSYWAKAQGSRHYPNAQYATLGL